MGRHNGKQLFKSGNAKQTLLFPPNLSDMIPEHHPVRTVGSVLDALNLESLISEYSTEGQRAYDPRTLLKILVFAYLNNIYSSRKIEACLRENIYMMWLSGMVYPDHNTLARFRTGRLRGHMKTIFFQVVRLLMDTGQIAFRRLHTDGTKLESASNKYTFVWGKSVDNYTKAIERNLEELWDYAERQGKKELAHARPERFEATSKEQVLETVRRIEENLEGVKVSKEVRRKLNYAKKRQAEKADEYREIRKKMGGRNSFSKTDPEATFMRMKDDPMRNGQLKPAYNLQVSTEGQYALNYSLHQTPGDPTTYKSHIGEIKEGLGDVPGDLVADSAYGSEENYAYVEGIGKNAYLKYPGLHKELKGKGRKEDKRPFERDKLYYNPERDCYYCPMGQRMDFVGKETRKTATGYIQEVKVYQAVRCEGCPLRGVCHKGKRARRVERNERVVKYRAEAKERLTSEKGVELRKERCADVEAFFGQMKSNKKFDRFLTRGLEKVSVEMGLVCLAMNLGKYSRSKAAA